VTDSTQQHAEWGPHEIYNPYCTYGHVFNCVCLCAGVNLCVCLIGVGMCGYGCTRVPRKLTTCASVCVLLVPKLEIQAHFLLLQPVYISLLGGGLSRPLQ